MLRIRAEQASALSVRQSAQFKARMAEHLREIFQEECAKVSDATLMMFIDKVVAQAERWGVDEEPLVERLLELFLCFDVLRQDPLPEWVTEVAEFPDRPQAQIVAMLEDRLLFEGAA